MSTDGTSGLEPWAARISILTGNALQAIDELLDEVLALSLHQGIERGLVAKLSHARSVLGDGNPRNDAAAEGSLGAFENQVSAQRGKKIAAADADRLSEFARQIIELLTGSGSS